MPLFKRKRASSAAQPGDTAGNIAPVSDERRQVPPSDALRDHATPTQEGLQTKSLWARIIPVGDIINGILGVLKDPNGKISSKRAGAGALVAAGIGFLTDGKLWEGGICLGFATLLFGLTKWEGGTPQNG